MSPLLRYTLFQLPGLVVAAVLLIGVWRLAGVPGWLAALLFALWVIKDAAFYPLLRRAYEGEERGGAARMIGQRGTARQDLAPRGYVALGSELWRAEVAPGGGPIRAGGAVRVVDARRLTLIVAPVDDGDGAM